MPVNEKFNSQIPDGNKNIFGNTLRVSKAVVKQLEGKPREKQEEIIAVLLNFLDVDMLAALALAYDVSQIGENKK